jgi:hypothetical protein
MKKLKVRDKDYALFEYTPFLDRNCNAVPRPKKTKYDLGDVVYIKTQNSIGVVLGCIDNESEDLRTDMDGMQCFSDIEPATLEHFKIKDVRFQERLLEDILLKDREENTKIIGGITHFKDNTFDYHKAKKIAKKHPLGDVYEQGSDGYVASGYDWFRFPVNRLSYIQDNY